MIRPAMRFVPVKTMEQQAMLALHRARPGFVAARTALVNQLRGLLAEFGVVMPQGINHLRRDLPAILEGEENELPPMARALFQRLGEHTKYPPALPGDIYSEGEGTLYYED